MATYYVDDGGSATDPYDTWAKAATSLSALDDAKTLASGDIIYIGHDHVCAYTHAASRTITGPTSGAPVYIISATQGSSPPTYQASTTNQIDTTEGAYTLTFDGSFAIYGVRINSGANIEHAADVNEVGLMVACTLAPAANGQIRLGNSAGARGVLVNCSVDLTADGTTPRSASVIEPLNANSLTEYHGLTFTNAGYRTGSVFGFGQVRASGCDFSGFTNATACEIFVQINSGQQILSNCKTAATWSLASGNPSSLGVEITAINCGTADDPGMVTYIDALGRTTNDTVTRTGGASVEGSSTGWKVTTTSGATEGQPHRTPWIYGVCSSTGSKTFTLYIGNNTADLKEDECWLEVESMGDAGGSPLSELNKDQRTDFALAHASVSDQTDDTGSTWSSAQTYMQSLAVTATVDQAGLFRARVAVAKASVTNLYVDPKVTVS